MNPSKLAIPCVMQFETNSKPMNKTIGAALMVAGTSIGAGLLGMPVVSAASGFLGIIVILLVVWAIMTFSAFAMLEVSLACDGETNFISMAGKTMGRVGRVSAWIINLCFLYSVMSAYVAGGTTIVSNALQISSRYLFFVTLVFLVPFMLFVFFGPKIVDRVNRFLTFSLLAAFIAMCFSTCGSSFGQEIFEERDSIKYIFFSLPLMVTSFGYHLLIPTLKTYLDSNIHHLRKAIIIGSVLPLVIYIIWQYIVLGSIATWSNTGLVAMIASDGNPGELLIASLASKRTFLSLMVGYFSFFALTSSLIGVALGLFDFLADGLNIEKTSKSRTFITLLVFMPPMLFTFVFPKGFLLALSYAGIFAAILLVIFPCLMAIFSRKQTNSIIYQVAGGIPALSLGVLFGIFTVVIVFLTKFNLVVPIPNL